jgi:hypothetical protein
MEAGRRSTSTFGAMCLAVAASGCTLMPGAQPGVRGAPGPAVPDAHSSQQQTRTEKSPEPDPELAHAAEWAEAILRRDDLGVRVRRSEVSTAGMVSPPSVETGPVGGSSDEPIERPPVAAEKPGDQQTEGPDDRGRMNDQDRARRPATQQATALPSEEAKPPVLHAVSATAAKPVIVEGRESTAEGPKLNAPQRAYTGPQSLDEFVQRLGELRSDAPLRDQLARRVLAALVGQDDVARQPLDFFPREQQELAAGLIEALLALRDGADLRDPQRRDALRRAVRRLDRGLRMGSDMEIAQFTLCTRVDGFGQFEPMEPAEFAAGGGSNEFVAYCQIDNFASRKDAGGAYVCEFGLRIAVLNRLGETVHTFEADEIVDRCRSLRRDCFLAPLVRLPASLGPGEYVVKVTISDRVGQKVAERQTTLRIASLQ